MPNNSSIPTIRLCKAQDAVPTVSSASTQKDASWLENDDTALLEDEHAKQADALKRTTDTKIHRVALLEIQYTSHGFFLATEQGFVKLNDGDKIALVDTLFQVNIINQSNNLPSQPEDHLATGSDEDIWQAPPLNVTAAPSMLHDPSLQTPDVSMAQTLVPQIGSTQQSDPLGFVYGQDNPLAQQSSVLPLAASGTRPYDQVSNLESHLLIPKLTHGLAQDQIAQDQNLQPLLQEQGNVTLDTQANYVPAMANVQNQAMETGRADASQGDILRDLGIDKNNAVLPEIVADNKKTTLTEQAPFDMIDEFLNDDMQAPVDYCPPEALVPRQSGLPNINGEGYPAGIAKRDSFFERLKRKLGN